MLRQKADFLDPRVKVLSFLSEEDQQTIASSVKAEVVKVALNSSARNIDSTVSVSPNFMETDDSSEFATFKKCRVSKSEKGFASSFS